MIVNSNRLNKTKIFGHRGAAGTHPENTLLSFTEAIEVGADGIELDLQQSQEGVLVVIHDETVDRTTDGTGWVKDMSIKELKQLNASSWFSHSLPREEIPTLEEVFDLTNSADVILNIELKNGLVQYRGIEEQLFSLIKKYRIEERVIISSFNHYSIVTFNKLAPHVDTAVLVMEGLYKPWEYTATVGAKGLHCYWPTATAETINYSQEKGIAVRPFTVNEEGKIRELISLNCDGLITDVPKLAIDARKKYPSKL
ncbi:MAG: glycerophosphodiester phosphodiesterase [Bacillota bacterium]|nr:glycerophosphodiester phosphodiesterase [Bacillota bacterium]